MAIKILASADLHIGKRTCGLSVFGEDCASKGAWRRLLDYSLSNDIDLVLLAGDVVDRENRYYEASGALRDGFQRLGARDIKVAVVAGNHDFDVLPQIFRNHPFDHVKLLGPGGTWEIMPFECRGEVIQVVGRSFARSTELSNPIVGLNAMAIDPDRFSIGLLHADVDNPSSRYAPVTLQELQQSPLTAWILGHIHKPIVFAGPKLIRYPGSVQALSAKEGGAHGALILKIEASKVIGIEEVIFSNCRFEELSIDVTAAVSEEDLRRMLETEISCDANDRLDELADVAFLVYDLHLMGRNKRAVEIEGWARPLTEGFELVLGSRTQVRVREISYSIRPDVPDLEALAREKSAAGILAETILAIQGGRSTPFLDELIQSWQEQFRVVTNSSGFQPLQIGFQRYGNPRIALPYIEEECNRLLSELIYPAN